MFIVDHKKIHAAASASFCVRISMGSLLVCAGLLGSSLAHADGDHDDQRSRRDEHAPAREVQRDAQRDAPRERQQQGAPVQGAPQQGAPQQRQADQQRPAEQQRQLDPRSFEARAEEQRRAVQEAGHNAEVNRRMGRMTPDERRDLRRQINEVGQDLYANPPRH